MGTVLDFNDFKKRADSRNAQQGRLPYSEVGEIREFLGFLPLITDEIHSCVELALSNAGFNPGNFKLSGRLDPLDMNLREFFSGGEEALSLAYEAEINGVLYCAVGSASVDNEEFVFRCEIVKWDGDQWLAYENHRWVKGPGADFI